MKVGPAGKYLGCVIVAGALGFYFGQKMSEPDRNPAAGFPGGRGGPPAVGRLQKGQSDAAAQAVSSAKWEGDAASMGLGKGPLTARLQRAFDAGEPFGVALAIQLLGQMTAAEAPEILNFLKSRKESSSGPNHNGPPVWIAFWISWGGIDPEAALAQIPAGVPAYPMNHLAESHIFHGLTMRDLEKAKALAVSRPTEASRSLATEATAYRWAETDPQAAAQWAMTGLEPPYRERAVAAIPWVIDQRHGAAQALEWWRSVPPGPAMQASFGSLVTIMARRSSRVTLEDQVALLKEGNTHGLRSQTLEGVVAATYATTDPLEGIALFGSLPASKDAQPYRGISTLVTRWGQTDPEAAGTWLVNQSSQPWNDDAIRGYITAIRKENPEAAAKWEASLRRPQTR